MLRHALLTLAALMLVASCAGTSIPVSGSSKDAVTEVIERPNSFPSYPQAGKTYLSFSRGHGFQVNYLAKGRAWLWYPGNTTVVPEEWKTDTISGTKAICWRHPSDSYNPVTRKSGGSYACESMSLAQKTIVASLSGDPFNLRSGAVPYRLDRCDAPEEFTFDRATFGCN